MDRIKTTTQQFYHADLMLNQHVFRLDIIPSHISSRPFPKLPGICNPQANCSYGHKSVFVWFVDYKLRPTGI